MPGEVPSFEPEVAGERTFSNKVKFEKLFLAKESGDEEQAAKIREEIIEFNKPLAEAFAKGFSASRKVEEGDYTSVAYEGLISAVDSFKYLDVAFSTYASYPIKNKLLREYNSASTAAGMGPERFAETRKAMGNKADFDALSAKIFSERRQATINRLKENNKYKKDYEPAEDEIAHELSLILERRLDLYKQISSGPVSLDQKKSFYDSESGAAAEVERDVVDDTLDGDPQKAAEDLELAEGVEKMLSKLDTRSQIIIAARYGLLDLLDGLVESSGKDELKAKYAMLADKSVDPVPNWAPTDAYYTNREIGELFGVTDKRINQLELEALKKMRHPGINKPIREYI